MAAPDKVTFDERTAFREALEALPEAVALFDADDRFVFWNARYAACYPGGAGLLRVGLPFESFLRGSIQAGDVPAAVGCEDGWVAERMARHALPYSIHENELANGRWVLAREMRTPSGGSVGLRTDITDLRRREASFKLLFESNPLPMLIFDSETLAILAVNDAALSLYGYDRERFLTLAMTDLRPARERAAFIALLQARKIFDYMGEQPWVHLRADGGEITVLPYSKSLQFLGRPAVISCIIDMTERQVLQERLIHMAHHDALTGLPNRVLFRERLVDALQRRERLGSGVVLLCVDLDGFKGVNDTYGHPVGDAMLREVGSRLTAMQSRACTVARLGGDEFAAILETPAAQPRDGTDLALSIVRALGRAYDIEGLHLLVQASVGIAVAPDGDADPDGLLRDADLALYEAKADRSGSTRVFEASMTRRAKQRRLLETDLRRAVDRAEFVLHFQPIVALASGQVRGFRTVLRWDNPSRGPVQSGDFSPLAEDLGLIVPIGAWAMREACAQAVAWPSALRAVVTVSAVHFRKPGLFGLIRTALSAAGLAAERLEIEVTEAVALLEGATNLALLHRIRDLGVKVSLGDFGTGSASMNYLRAFPFDRLTIDGSLVRDITGKAECLAMVRATLGLAADLGIATGAGGIETDQQMERLRSGGCAEGQGPLFGPAVAASSLGTVLAARARVADAA